MLVLSRRLKEKIHFPSIDAFVQVLAIKSGAVRLGIEAPPEINVVREEILDPSHHETQREASREVPAAEAASRRFKHQVRNRLNAAGIGLAVLRKQLNAGNIHDLEATLAKIDSEVRALRENVESALERNQSRSAPRPTRRALLVEDDDNERELLAGLLRMAGLDVATAGDGSNALDYLRARGRPDVVLLDMVLPRCDGPTIVREVRRDPAYAGLKIFALSGYSPHEVGLDGDGPAVDRWFRKPIDPAALLGDLELELEKV